MLELLVYVVGLLVVMPALLLGLGKAIAVAVPPGQRKRERLPTGAKQPPPK